MRAAAVNTIIVPGGNVHEGFDEKSEGVFFAQLEALKNIAEFGIVAAALREVGEIVANLVVEEALHLREVDELRDASCA